MILPVLRYGHPALRQKGVHIETVTPRIKQLISDMFETMYAAKGVGLAAQQVGHPLQLTVIDVRGVTDRPSTLALNGQAAIVAEFMPMVLINPLVKPLGESATGPEGCLSFPEIYVDITRPESIDVTATNEKGQRLEFRCGGLLARVVQHEYDHLQGILFIDRMTKEDKMELKPQLEDLQAQTKADLKKSASGGAPQM